MIHSEESKLEKASFTGACFSLGNSAAATTKVKANYSKTRNAFIMYYQAMLHAAWLKMLQDYPAIREDLISAKDLGKVAFLTKFR